MSEIINFQERAAVKRKLSPTSERVLEYVRDYISANGYAPSYRDIADGCYCGSGTAHTHVGILQDQGYLTTEPGKPRSIRLSEPVSEFEPVPWSALDDLVRSCRHLTSSQPDLRHHAQQALDRASRLCELRIEYLPSA